MADVRYRIKIGQKPTEDQVAEIEEAKKKPIVFDDDCPEITEENNPKLYEAMMQAVIERNQRISNRERNLA
mgnify:CR=1 FL=1